MTGITKNGGSRLVTYPELSIIPLPQLLYNHPPFLVDLLVFQSQIPRPIVQDQQHRVHDTFPFKRDLRQLIVRHFHPRCSIQVSPELHPDTFQPPDHAITRKMLGPVEHHVFQKMRQPILRILFLNRPHVIHDVEIRQSRRLGIMPQIIPHPIVKFSNPHARILREYIPHIQLLGRNNTTSHHQQKYPQDNLS